MAACLLWPISLICCADYVIVLCDIVRDWPALRVGYFIRMVELHRAPAR